MDTDKIDGIVERFALFPHVNGTTVYILMAGDNRPYVFDNLRRTYFNDDEIEGPTELAVLTQAGDHVWFEAKYGEGVEFTFRNWTVEQRLSGETKDVGDAKDNLITEKVINTPNL